mmetsp:Transcript_25300/g.60926  ORF Transcript_25300/g.60926 Transcript_25300/m.60926 type:complete len:249 (+) Transcript_25300:8175-8921(+)
MQASRFEVAIPGKLRHCHDRELITDLELLGGTKEPLVNLDGPVRGRLEDVGSLRGVVHEASLHDRSNDNLHSVSLHPRELVSVRLAKGSHASGVLDDPLGIGKFAEERLASISARQLAAVTSVPPDNVNNAPRNYLPWILLSRISRSPTRHTAAQIHPPVASVRNKVQHTRVLCTQRLDPARLSNLLLGFGSLLVQSQTDSTRWHPSELNFTLGSMAFGDDPNDLLNQHLLVISYRQRRRHPSITPRN